MGLPGSAIPVLTQEEMYPDKERVLLFPAEGANAVGSTADGRLVRFDGADFFARNQVDVDYISAETPDFPQCFILPDRLVQFRSKLQNPGKEVRVLLLGDSITDGWNASGKVGVAPFQLPWAELVRRELEKRYPATVIFENLAVSGSSSCDAVKIADRWENKKFDLLILAYGMNDFSWRSAAEDINTYQEIMAVVKRANPEAEFLLVNPMTGNPEWLPTVPGPDALYSEALMRLALSRPDTALADVRAYWKFLVERKGFFSLTGNGVNHPNDYGHRIYASVV